VPSGEQAEGLRKDLAEALDQLTDQEKAAMPSVANGSRLRRARNREGSTGKA
jgi:hypothetical protein